MLMSFFTRKSKGEVEAKVSHLFPRQHSEMDAHEYVSPEPAKNILTTGFNLINLSDIQCKRLLNMLLPHQSIKSLESYSRLFM
ncbi:CLUMA_CG011264, isoform A [Clunio marinus]|uniref:CLUMA_CG011264, isoform A n=1 Tax=Clunio marinus TaxID=568069 RepID=A0A1J1IHG7_9DIPT|nr:CLUMA_CG011264, isoform A [Clunio marinus]